MDGQTREQIQAALRNLRQGNYTEAERLLNSLLEQSQGLRGQGIFGNTQVNKEADVVNPAREGNVANETHITGVKWTGRYVDETRKQWIMFNSADEWIQAVQARYTGRPLTALFKAGYRYDYEKDQWYAPAGFPITPDLLTP